MAEFPKTVIDLVAAQLRRPLKGLESAESREKAVQTAILASARQAAAANGVSREEADRLAQSFAFLTGASDVHPDEMPVRPSAQQIIEAGKKRRGEAGTFTKADDVPRNAQGKPLTGPALAIVNAGKRRRGEIE